MFLVYKKSAQAQTLVKGKVTPFERIEPCTARQK